MKSEKAMSYKMLIICVLIIAVLIITAGYFINNKVEGEKIKTYQTDKSYHKNQQCKKMMRY